jgi:hypothetical protein
MKKQRLILASCAALIGAWVHASASTPASFKAEPVFFKGSGSTEGVECADLNRDGKVDLLSAVPMSGNIGFYENIGTAGKPSFAAKVLLTDPQTGKPVRLHHW